MRGLLVLLGVLAAGSGALKVLGRGRSLPGVAFFGLLELAGGAGVTLTALSRDPGPAPGLTLILLMLGLTAVSTGVQIRQVRARRQHRQTTEDARLYTFVKYLSRDLGNGSGPAGEESETP